MESIKSRTGLGLGFENLRFVFQSPGCVLDNPRFMLLLLLLAGWLVGWLLSWSLHLAYRLPVAAIKRVPL